MNLAEQLNSSKGEREPHAILEKYPEAVFSAVNSFPNNSYLISEFYLGSQFRADFVALSGASGMFDVEFIELKAIDEKMFKTNGDPSTSLSHAIRQVSDWLSFANRNESYLREELNRQSKEKDLLNTVFRKDGITCNAGFPITDPVVHCGFRFHIFIGRRESLSKADFERKVSMSQHSNFSLGTWDRFLDYKE